MTMKDTTATLYEARNGSRSATGQLLKSVYGELRNLAGGLLRGERRDHSLQPTALVHEAYVRLLGGAKVDWESKTHFYAVAARCMRRVLIQIARDRRAKKRGGEAQRVTLIEGMDLGRDSELDLLDLTEALQRLRSVSKRQSSVVDLRFFGGLSIEETGRALGLSEKTVRRDWVFAKAWLRRELATGDDR